MAFIPKIWQGREVEHPGRIVLTPTGNPNEYDVSRSEGQVTSEGDFLGTVNLNDLEQRISNGTAAGDGNGNSLNALSLGGVGAENYAQALSGTKNVYVSTSGNDTTGDGTSAKPYRTLAKAVSILPYYTNGNYTARLNISGVYTEVLNLSGFNYPIILGGTPTIGGLVVSRGTLLILNTDLSVTAPPNTTGNMAEITQLGALNLQGYTLTLNGAAAVTLNGGMFIDSSGAVYTSVASGSLIITMANGSSAAILYLNGTGRAYLNNLEITAGGAAYGLRVWGAYVSYNNYTFTQGSGSGGTATHTARGGRVVTGAQT